MVSTGDLETVVPGSIPRRGRYVGFSLLLLRLLSYSTFDPGKVSAGASLSWLATIQRSIAPLSNHQYCASAKPSGSKSEK